MSDHLQPPLDLPGFTAWCRLRFGWVMEYRAERDWRDDGLFNPEHVAETKDVCRSGTTFDYRFPYFWPPDEWPHLLPLDSQGKFDKAASELMEKAIERDLHKWVEDGQPRYAHRVLLRAHQAMKKMGLHNQPVLSTTLEDDNYLDPAIEHMSALLDFLERTAEPVQAGKADSKPDKTEKKHPENPLVAKLLNQEKLPHNKGKNPIKIAREITEEDEIKAKSITRQARRFRDK